MNTEGFVALSTAYHTAAWTPASVPPNNVQVHGATAEAARDRLCWLFSIWHGGWQWLFFFFFKKYIAPEQENKEFVCLFVRGPGSASE